MYVKRLGILLITVALIVVMGGCALPSQNLEIRDWYDLDDIRDNLRGYHILMNDLDSTTAGYTELASETANQGKGWQPIETWGHPFKGSFDGQGYEIRDLFINRPDESGVGLFGYVGVGGVIKNVNVVNATVTGGRYVGGLGGENKGTVSNSYSSSNVNGRFGIGGLMGDNWGSVSNSYSTGSVTGKWLVGGLVGDNWGSVSNSYSTGSVTGTEFKVGGLVGFNFGTVSNSYSTGSVSGSDEYVGGLVGDNYHGTVSNSFWDTETSGQATLDGGTGKTTAEMKSIATFLAWDIIAVDNPSIRNPAYIWNIVDDETYPFLSWEP
jgi:hypothetical protein